MNEYCWFFSFAVHHFLSQPTQHSQAERLNLPFSATIFRNDECCGGWGSIMRTQDFGGQRARSVNHSSTSISALVEACRGIRVLKFHQTICHFYLNLYTLCFNIHPEYLNFTLTST